MPLLFSVIYAQRAYRGNVGMNLQYFTDTGEQRETIAEISGELEREFSHKRWRLKTLIDANFDTNDQKRNYLLLNEVYLNYAFDDADLRFGKEIKFWGALEAFNITDVFNSYNLRKDLLDFEKLGSWNAAYMRYFESSELSFIVKWHEESQPFASSDYPYYMLPPGFSYDEKLHTEKNRFTPTYFLKYSGTTDTTYPLDFAIILQSGYDNNRQLIFNGSNFYQYAYQVDRIMTYNTMLVGDTLLKLEASYTDVKHDKVVSDYTQAGFGFEHTLYGVRENMDLGIITEYYMFDSDNETQELLQTFGNDLFVGTRLTFNDMSDTSLLAGIIQDVKYNETLFKAEFERRVFESYKLKIDLLYTNPSDTDETALKQLGDVSNARVSLAYYF